MLELKISSIKSIKKKCGHDGKIGPNLNTLGPSEPLPLTEPSDTFEPTNLGIVIVYILPRFSESRTRSQNGSKVPIF